MRNDAADATERTVPANGIELCYETFGSPADPTVLLIMGLGTQMVAWHEAFCQQLVASRERLDFIINNACQTVRRPPEFYAHMMEGETAALKAMPAATSS